MTTDEKKAAARQAEKDFNVEFRIRHLKARKLSEEQLLAEAAEWYVAATNLYVEVKGAQHLAGEGLEKFITTSNALSFALGRIEHLNAERIERVKGANFASRKVGNHLAMTEVFIHWQQWQENPGLYKGPTAFARAMQKEYSTLQNIDSIKNAVYRWKKTPHEVRDGVVVKKEQSN